MKKTRPIGMIIVLALFLCGPAGAQAVKQVRGVTVVSNGKTPSPPPGQAAKISLTEELSIGGGDDPNQAFSEVVAFVVDPEGTVFALDFKDANIKVYDKAGAFLRLIGKKGQGPGELGMPSGIMRTGDGEILVEDQANRRLAFFKASGEFIKNISTADRMGVVSLVLDPQGGFLGREMGMAEGNARMFFDIKKFDQDLKPLFSLDKIDFPVPLPGSGVKLNPMEMMSFYQIDGDGRIYYGRNIAYEIKVYDRKGAHIRTIQKDYERTKIGKEDIDEFMERSASLGAARDLFSFPEYFPPYQQLTVDDRGRLFVRSYVKGKAAREYGVDVFDGEGRYIAQFFTTSSLQYVREGKAYGIEETDDGFRVIKRYAVSWR